MNLIVGYALWDLDTANVVEWIDGPDLHSSSFHAGVRQLCQKWIDAGWDKDDLMLVAEYTDGSMRKIEL